MNMQVGQQVVSRSELERMCLAHIRMLAGSQHTQSVRILARPGSARNWVVLEIEPSLPTAADNEARNALAELQRQFRLAD